MSRPKYRPRKSPKAGLTAYEQRIVAVASRSDQERWQYLFSLNKWKPSAVAAKGKMFDRA